MMIVKAVMFAFLFGGVISLIGVEKSVIKSSGTVDSAEICILYRTPQKH